MASLPGICNVAADGARQRLRRGTTRGSGRGRALRVRATQCLSTGSGRRNPAHRPLRQRPRRQSRGSLCPVQLLRRPDPPQEAGSAHPALAASPSTAPANESTPATRPAARSMSSDRRSSSRVMLQPPTEVTGNKARLHAKVNPAGSRSAPASSNTTPTPPTGRANPRRLPSDEADHPVAAQLTGLTPNTEYHSARRRHQRQRHQPERRSTFTTTSPRSTGEATADHATKATLTVPSSPKATRSPTANSNTAPAKLQPERSLSGRYSHRRSRTSGHRRPRGTHLQHDLSLPHRCHQRQRHQFRHDPQHLTTTSSR